MQMTEEEIVRRYKQADNKRKSIRILAELNGCQKQTIRDILEANGLGVPKTGNRYTAQARALKEKMATDEAEADGSERKQAKLLLKNEEQEKIRLSESETRELKTERSENVGTHQQEVGTMSEDPGKRMFGDSLEAKKAAPTTCVAPEPVTVWPEAPNEVLNAAIERLIEIEGQLEELQRKKMMLDAQIGDLENMADRFRAWIEATREAKHKEE